MTTLIFGGGFLAYNISLFNPTADQGNVLAGIFFLALAFDLFVLPPLLIFFDTMFSGKNLLLLG